METNVGLVVLGNSILDPYPLWVWSKVSTNETVYGIVGEVLNI